MDSSNRSAHHEPEDTEAFVRRMLAASSKNQVDDKTVREIVRKIERVVPAKMKRAAAE